MKAFGPIPPEFKELRALQWVSEATPAYIYDFAIVSARIAGLRAAMPKALDIHYAIKANPMPALLAAIAPLVDGMDVASAGEMTRALGVMAGNRISFAGPGKRDAELEAAIRAGVTLNLESISESQRALAIGKALGVRPRLAIRVNPDFELRGSGMKMGGRASPFGVEVEHVPELVRGIVAGGGDWRGFHIFAGSQSLDTQAIIETQAATVALAGRLAKLAKLAPPLVNLGGGFGIPYFAGDTPVDIVAIGTALGKALKKLPKILSGTQFAIELGRYIVGEAGVYLARVIDRKISSGETFLIVDGGLNHHLAATGNFGTVVKRNYPVAVTHRMQDVAEETVTIVGPLCTPLDRLADRVALPRAEMGDVIAIFASGAYGASASPSAFLGHAPVRELLVDSRGH
ncbi:pyridoxal-dependent decarboxylase, exosortase A system-associated [Sphingomonas sp.]|jgi:diaminopimelate decarboxylase|uniref:pyridoxal-dependent decarboxylase, exosortase A system-associated n=1 Tax=Sphingomonas sp. TaxID=28214 RepID=UPI002ED7C83D